MFRPTLGSGIYGVLLTALVALSACAPQAPQPSFAGIQPQQQPQAQVQRAEVTLLLPLSGPNAAIGNAMLNAAQLALFEQGSPGFEFVPRDTGGTGGGAAAAAREAIAAGSRIMVGPLTAPETASVATVARAANVPVLALTNDATIATPGVWTLGVTPAQQVRRVVSAAADTGAKKFALAAPEGPFARQLAAELRASTAALNLPEPLILTYPRAALPQMAARDLASRAGEAGIDALLIGEGGQRAKDFVSALPEAGLTVPPLRLMGTALWANDDTLITEPVLAGAIYPSADPASRMGFESRYQSVFGDKPARISAIAYDAAALAARAMRAAGPGMLPSMPVGEVFLGAEGALRLTPTGQVQRALTVFAIAPGTPRVVEPATLPSDPNS